MKFYLPLPVGTRINQKFGENSACISFDGSKVITCNGHNPPSGYKSVYGPQGHTGTDFSARHGQEVYCALGGVVDSIDTNKRTGLDVRVVSYVDGVKYQHIYEHLLGYKPQVGDYIPTGYLIGWADNTGLSSADHLHFQINKWENNRWVPVDPEKHLINKYAKDVLFEESKTNYALEGLALALDRLADSLRSLIIYLSKKNS